MPHLRPLLWFRIYLIVWGFCTCITFRLERRNYSTAIWFCSLYKV